LKRSKKEKKKQNTCRGEFEGGGGENKKDVVGDYPVLAKKSLSSCLVMHRDQPRCINV
jgi:hypothetical protein